jgi:hypothetical protein
VQVPAARSTHRVKPDLFVTSSLAAHQERPFSGERVFGVRRFALSGDPER